MSRRGSGLMLMALLSAALITGCGGGDKGLSKSELVKQANAVCKRHNEKISSAASRLLAGGKLPSRQQLGQLALATVVPEYTAQIKELRALKPPEDVKDAYGKWLDDSDAARAMIEKNPSFLTNPVNFSTVNREADQLGFSRDCHAGPS